MKISKKVLIAILLMGVAVRVFLCFTGEIFTDEVFYLEVVQKHNIMDFVLITHWIKDHGILHFILLKGGLLMSSNIKYLRLLNIPLYVGSAYVLFNIFQSLKFGKWSLVPILFFSFERYFMRISATILPYNLVIFFSLLSILYYVKVFFTESHKPKLREGIAFIIFTALAFYSDYSFLSMTAFYFLALILAVYLNKKNITSLVAMYGATAALITPGVFQLLHNITVIQYQNNTIPREENLSLSLQKFFRMIEINVYSPVPSYVFGLYTALFICGIVFLIYKKGYFSYQSRRGLFILIGASYYISILFFLLINQFIFPAFVERACWFFFLFKAMLISFLIFIYNKRDKKICVLLVLMCTLILIFNISKNTGGLRYEISYTAFISKYSADKEAKNDEYLFVLDEGYVLYPLAKYYLSRQYILSEARVHHTTLLPIQENLIILYSENKLLNQKTLRILNATKGSVLTTIKYSVLTASRNLVRMDSDFVKGAQTIYTLEKMGDKERIFIKLK